MDITIAHPQTDAHVQDASRTGGAAATNLEGIKYRTYGSICNAHNITLNPFGMDVFGAFGRDAIEFVKRLSIFIAQRRGTLPHEEEQHLYERITIALHALQGRMINTRQVV